MEYILRRENLSKVITMLNKFLKSEYCLLVKRTNYTASTPRKKLTKKKKTFRQHVARRVKSEHWTLNIELNARLMKFFTVFVFRIEWGLLDLLGISKKISMSRSRVLHVNSIAHVLKMNVDQNCCLKCLKWGEREWRKGRRRNQHIFKYISSSSMFILKLEHKLNILFDNMTVFMFPWIQWIHDSRLPIPYSISILRNVCYVWFKIFRVFSSPLPDSFLDLNWNFLRFNKYFPIRFCLVIAWRKSIFNHFLFHKT